MARPRIKKPPKLKFEINLLSFLLLIKTAFLQPFVYVSQIPPAKDWRRPVGFLIANVSIGYFISAIWEQISNINHPSIFFALSQLIILIPAVISSLFLGSVILFIIAKTLKGEGNFKQTFNILAYCSLPLIFLPLPGLRIPAFIWLLLLNIKGFKDIHKYSIVSAIFNIISPLFLLILVGVIVGAFKFTI